MFLDNRTREASSGNQKNLDNGSQVNQGLTVPTSCRGSLMTWE